MITLKQTCRMFPEQYDVKLDGVQVGYLRLRHGHFRVDFPECGDETIYEATPEGNGCFEDDERGYYLRAAVDAVLTRLGRPALGDDAFVVEECK
jgi:hypothetical protein